MILMLVSLLCPGSELMIVITLKCSLIGWKSSVRICHGCAYGIHCVPTAFPLGVTSPFQRIRRGALGFSVLRFWIFFWSVFRFLCQKTSVFRFWCSMRFADFSFFSIWFSVFVENTSGFSVLVPDVVFGFSYFFFPVWTYLGSALSLIKRQLISNSRNASQCYWEECVTNWMSR